MADGSHFERSSDESSFFLKGTCFDMCPARERSSRERQRRLHPFEIIQDILPGQKKLKNPKANIESTVKEYSRPAAGRHLQPDELRPASVLVKTMDFLLKDVLAKPDPWYFKCEFVSDRIRAVRQDLTAQGFESKEAVDVLEKTIRYYLVTAVKLCKEPVENFDPVLQDTHIQECLKKLLLLYKSTNSNPEFCRNRPSFEACYLLLNLGNTQVYHRSSQLPEPIRKSGVLRLAVRLTNAYLLGNFVAVFRTLTHLPFLESCAFFRHIQPIRCKALEVMTIAYSSRNMSYPLSLLKQVLYFHSEELARDFCNGHGITARGGGVFFSKGEFLKPENHKPLAYPNLVMSKLKDDITDLLLFHRQTNWNDNVDKSSEKSIEIENEVSLASTVQETCMVGVRQRGLVTSEKRPTYGRGRGRGKKIINPKHR